MVLYIFYYLFLLDFIYRRSLFSIFTTLIYHKVLINNNTEQDTEQDKQTKLLVEQFTYIITQYIWTVLQWTMHDENMRKYLKNKNSLLLRYALMLHPLKVSCFKDINWRWMLYMNRQNVPIDLEEYNCKGHVDLSILEWISDVNVKDVLKYSGAPPWRVLYICRAFWYITLSEKGINFYSEKKNAEGVLKSLSKNNLAARFWNFVSLSSR